MDRKPPSFAVKFLPGWEELNGPLRAALLDMAATVPDNPLNNRSGKPAFINRWQSQTRLHLDGPPVFARLAAAIEAATEDVTQRAEGVPPLRIDGMWSLISRGEMRGRPHDHVGRVSIAYYVDPGTAGPDDGGLLLFFEDPERREPTRAVAPQPGLLVIFPSSLYHAVSPYRGTAPRIVVSANLS